MADDILTADAPPFREIPAAIEILEEHDAYCSYEAAVLLRATLGILTVPSVPEEVYDILIDAIGRIASLSDRHRDQLPERMLTFLDRVDDASANYTCGGDEDAGETVAAAPATVIDYLPPVMARLRTHDANGSFAAADLLEAAHRILVAPNNPGTFGLKLTNADYLRMIALGMHTG